MKKFILDTNFFFNMEIKSGFGKNSKEVIVNFSNIAAELKKTNKAEFFMPPRIVDEYLSFVSADKAYGRDFLTMITIKSPDTADIQFPAAVFYQLIEEIRDRSYRGLRIGEEAVEQAGRRMLSQPSDLSNIEYQKTIGSVVVKLRERYRQATRFNFLDSVADLDLIMLSKELNGTLVSSDEGVLRWGHIFGITEVPAGLFREQLLSL